MSKSIVAPTHTPDGVEIPRCKCCGERMTFDGLTEVHPKAAALGKKPLHIITCWNQKCPGLWGITSTIEGYANLDPAKYCR